MDLRKIFGGHIRRLRKGRLLTQEELATRSGISTDGVRRVESGATSPGLNTIARLAHALEISLTHLFAGLEADRTPAGARDLLSFLDGLSETQRRKALTWMVQTFGGST
jgi:transcriptional regulator with XRE-family HTH domain